MSAMTSEELYAWCKAHKDELIAARKAGDATARTIVSTHDMMKIFPENAAYAILEQAVEEYIARAADNEAHDWQYLEMRVALTEAGVDHIGKSIAESIRLLAKDCDALRARLNNFTQPRFILHRKENGVYGAIGRFPDISSAREHANADGKMRGRVNRPYMWGVYENGMWVTRHPNYDPGNQLRLYEDDDYDDYLVLDADWSPVENSPTTIEIPPPYEFHKGDAPDGE